MPLLKKDSNLAYRPKVARISDLYKHSVKTNKMSGSIKKQIRRTLEASGKYRKIQLSKMINDQELPMRQLREVADHLNKDGVFGFNRSGKSLTDSYTLKEIAKRKSIQRIIQENRAEQAEEPLTDYDKQMTSGKKSGKQIPPKINLKI